MLNCPKCGSPSVHRSRTRGLWERARKNFTHDRIHRCHGCGWRGWGSVTSEPVRSAPNLEAIGIAVSQTQSRDAE